jgi:hypothetical protein
MFQNLRRECGHCDVCCTVGGVPEIEKEPYQKCVHQCGKCAIFGEESRPRVCNTFECSWLRGFGNDSDRPDLIGAMFAVNKTIGGTVQTAIEIEHDALKTKAKEMAVLCAKEIPLPIICVRYGSLPPKDIGDWIIASTSVSEQWKRNIGEELKKMDDSVSLYTLRFD